MIAYFTRLLNYDLWATNKLIDTMTASGQTTGKTAQTIAHCLVAQQTWVKRCKMSLRRHRNGLIGLLKN
jgi:hypothetical protein